MNAPFPTQTDNSQRFIESAEAARDLKVQLAGLGGEEEREIQFIEWSPGRRMVTIWNMETGEEVTLPRYQALAALNTPRPGGGWQWTARKEMAPAPFVPSVPCFLHPDSPHRELLREMGITQTCMTMLADPDSAEQHAKRHPSRWARFKSEMARREKAAEKEAQAAQTAAILKLAGARGKGSE